MIDDSEAKKTTSNGFDLDLVELSGEILRSIEGLKKRGFSGWPPG